MLELQTPSVSHPTVGFEQLAHQLILSVKPARENVTEGMRVCAGFLTCK